MSPREVVAKARRTKVLGFSLDSQAWRTVKRKHKAHSKTHNLPCWLAAHGMCLLDGKPIDYTTTGRPDSYETDHKQTRKERPDLAMVWANFGASHLRCNRSRQAKHVGPEHVWVRPKF